MSVRRRFIGIQCLSVYLFLTFNFCTAHAGMMISADNVTVPQGQSAVVDIWVHSDVIGGEFLTVFNTEFRVTPESGIASVLEIASVPDISGELNYVFAGSSLGFTGKVLGPPNDVAVVGDFGFAMLDGTPRLLARLLLQPGPGILAPTEGDRFRVELVPMAGDSFDFLLGNSNTGFLNLESEPIDFNSSIGIVEMTSNVVPEPGVTVLWVVGFYMSTVACRRRRSEKWLSPTHVPALIDQVHNARSDSFSSTPSGNRWL